MPLNRFKVLATFKTEWGVFEEGNNITPELYPGLAQTDLDRWHESGFIELPERENKPLDPNKTVVIDAKNLRATAAKVRTNG